MSPSRFTRLRHALAACATCLLCACASTPSEHFYTLQASDLPLAQPPIITPGSTMPLHLQLAQLSVPDLVDKPQIVIRKSAHQVQILEQQRWAEPLRSSLARVLSANLRAQGVLVTDRRQQPDDQAWQLWVEVLQLEAWPGKEVVLEVQWQVRTPQGAVRLSDKGVWRASVSGNTVDDILAAHQQTLAQCALDIGKRLQHLPPPAER